MIGAIILALAVAVGPVSSQQGCNTKVDVTFLLDSSDNVGKDNHQKQLQFVKDTMSKMNIGPNKVQASVVTYGAGVSNQFYLNQYLNNSGVQNAITNIPFKGGSTHHPGDAIRYATGTSFSPLHGGRSAAPHVAIVVTNGPSGAIDMTKLEAQTARDNGVILYAVGVGSGVDQNELQAIASDPDSRHLFKAQNYDALRSLSDLLATKVCNELPPDPSAFQTPTGCLQKADLVFMIDSSSSVGSTNFQKLEHFLKSVVSKLDVGPGKVQVGMMKYGSYPSVEFSLNAYKTRPEVMKAIEGMTYLGGGTNDADAISFTGRQIFSQSNGARGNVPRIGVLITDGGSANPSAAINAANKARTEHIGMMTIGVGNRVNAHELNSIADGRADAFQVSSYDNLDTITNQLINQMCKVNTTEPSLTTAAPGATLPPDTCVDRLGNCDMYGSQVCRDYKVWAVDNCKKFCGVCTPLYTAGPPKCQDNLPSCSAYGKDNCKNMPTWARSNCPLFCGFCGTNTTASGYYGKCFYKGQSYTTGQKWYDGCDYECFCEDGNSGKYKCNNRCPVYHNMPSDCTLVTQPGQCCLKPVCNFQPTVDTHTASGHGTTPDGIDVCVYKGHQYFQGQSWRDGCDYQCRCTDSKKGVYKCDDVCPSYNSIPPYCHLEQKAGECCRKPVCEFSTQTGSFGGSGSISGNGVGATPTAHPPCLDVINTCNTYGKSVCTAYRGWAANNCRKYCDLCPSGLPKPGPTDQCIYAGNFYNQGDAWNTSCSTQCVCENAIYGYYRCVDTCPTYNNIPSGCKMVKNAGDCCPTLQCSNGYFLTSSPNLGSIGNGGQMNISHPPTGMTQIRPTVTTGQALIPGTGGTGFQAPTLTGCLYKGTLYVQGQVWEDGCDYTCECSQAYTGLYTCRQKCPTYPTLQPSCVLVVDTNDACCRTPKCQPDPVTHKIPVPIPVFQSSISSHGSVQPPMHQTGGGSGKYSRTVYLAQTGLTPAPPTAPSSFVTGGIGHCTYKGVQYQQGQTWEDGCQFNCVCDDATKGHYQCVEKCVHYNNLPKDCYLEKDPANPCCDRPKCVFPVNYVTDVGQVHTTPAPRGAHCVYNGQSYSQGQTWYDGCSYKCTCEDALNNIYRCLTRCPQYTNIGANCEFAPDPKDPACCQRPECYDLNTTFTGFCTAPKPAAIGTYVGQGIGLGYCEYKGVHYNQTDKWTDGCDLLCECTDVQTGLYRCTDKCPRYFNIPPYCTLITDFANPCCKKPRCNFAACNGQTTQRPVPGSSLPPTPLAPGETPPTGYTPGISHKYCVYKGVNYAQGQTWEDGCNYKCRCDDADQGLYTCSERCATYNPPKGCVMMADPADSCCLIPSCLPVTQSTVRPSPGVSTPPPTPYRIPTAAPGQITGSANVPTPIPGSGLPTPAPLKYCVYKGQQYAQGQTWEDGCDYTCECVDAHIGQYKCSEKCTKYVGLPVNCRLARDPANPCCQVPECSSTPYNVPTPGPTGHQSPTPAPQPKNVCVYKGVSYTQGQTWYDGCDYMCDCENSGLGLYRCNNRCPSYDTTALPKECHMEPSSKDPLCCQEPKCAFVPYTNQTTGFVPVPTPPPGVIDGGVATPNPIPTLKPSPGYHPTPGPTATSGVCVYKGNQYQQGQKWQDGCVYNCECLDALAGHYRCTEMCPKYEELPAGCRLISDYNNPCCKKAYCDVSKVPTPAPPGISTPKPVPGSKSGCVYNGVTFVEGQQWNDGCDLRCVCEDETTGFYRCNDRCAKYNPPEYCTLVTDPRDSCCKVPSCPSVTPTPKSWAPGMVPTPAPGVTFSPNRIPTPGPGLTYAPGMYPTWVPGMVPTPAPGMTFAPYRIPTPGPGLTYAPGMYPTWVPGMVPTPAPGRTYAPNKVPTPGPGLTYAPGMYPTWVPGMVPTPAPGKTFAPNKIPTPGPGQTYAPGMYPTWVPGMVPTPAPGKTFAPNKIPTPGPGRTYAPGMYPTWVPGMVPTPAPGYTFAPNKVPTPGPGQTYAPGMFPTWAPGMIPTPAPGRTFAPNKIPTPAPGSTYAPGMYPTWVPGMVPTPAPGMTFAPNKIPTPYPYGTYAPGMYPTWVPGMIPTPAPGFTYAPNKVPTPAPGSTYAPGMFPTWVPGMVPTPAPGYTYPPYLIPTPAPGLTYAPGKFPEPSTTVYPTPAPGQTYPPYVPGMIPTPAPGKTYAPNLIPTPAPGSTYAPGKFPTWVPGMVPTVRPGVTVPWWLIPTPAPGSTYAPFHIPTWVPGMIPTPAPGYTFAPNKVPTPAPGQTYAPGLYPTWAPGMVPTPAPGVTYAPNKVPTPGPGQTYAPGMYPTWVPGMVPTPAPGYTFAPNKVPTPAPGSTYAPGMFPTWAPGMIPTPAPGVTYAPNKVPTPGPGKTYAPGMYPTWVPGMAPTPAPGKTFAPDKVPTPAPGSTYAPGKFPTFIPGFMVPTPAPGVTFGPNRVPTPAPGSTYAPGMIPTWVPGMVPTPAPGVTYAPNKVPTPGPGKTYAPGLYPTWVPGMAPTPAPGKTFAPDKIPTPAPGSTYAPGKFPTFIPGFMVPTPAPGVTFGPNKVPTPAPGSTYAPGMIPTWVPGMVPTPAPGMTYAPNKVPTPGYGKTYAPGMYPTWVPGMAPTPAPGKTFAPDKIPTPAQGSTYAPGKFPTFIPGFMVPTPAPGVTFGPNKVPTPAPGSTYAPGMIPTWVPGMVPTPAPGMTYAPNKVPTPGYGKTYAPGMYPTWVPGMAPTPAPGKTFAPDKVPTPAPGSTYAPGKFPTFIPGFMVPTPAPGVTFGPNKVPTPAPGSTYAPGMIPTWVPGMVPTPAPGMTYAPDRVPTPGPGKTYAPGLYPTWVPGMAPTPAPGKTFAPNKVPTPAPGSTYAPGMFPTFIPGFMVPTPAPGVTFGPNKVPTPAPGSTYAPGMIPTWIPGMVPTPAPGYTYPPYLVPTPAPGKTYAPGKFPVPSTTVYPTPAPGQTYPPYKPGMIPTPAPGKTYAPNMIPTPAPGSTYAPGKFPTWVPGMVPTVRPGVTVPWWLIPTPAPGSTYAPFHIPTWVPGMIPTPAPGVTYAPNKVPTPAPGSTYAPGLYPTWVPGMAPTPAPGKTFAPDKVPTPAPGSTYAPGMFPTFIPGFMVPTPAPGVTFGVNKVPTPAPGSTYAPGMIPTWVPGMVPTPAPGMTYAPNKIPTPYPGRTYAPGMFPTYVPGMAPTPAPGKTFAPNKLPTPGPGLTYAPGMYPTFVPGLMVPTPAPGVTYAPNKVPTPGPGLTYAPGMYPTWVPGMIPTPAPGKTFAPNKIPTPYPGQTYAPGMYPTWVPGMAPTPAPGKTFAPNKIPTPGPGQTYAPGMFPTYIPGLMIPTPAPGVTYAPNKIPTPWPGHTYAPGQYPTWVPGMVPTPAPGKTYAPNKIPTPGPGRTYAPGMYPTWVPGMAPTPAPGKTFAPDKIPTPAPGSTYAPGMFPTFIPGFMVPTPAPGVTFGPNKVPSPAPGRTYAPGQIPTWVPGMVPTPAPGITYAPNKIPTPGPGKTYAPGMFPTWVPGMVPTPAPGKTFAPNKLPSPAPGSTYAPGMYPTFIPGLMVPTPAPGVTFGPDKVPTPAPGSTYAPGMYPTWVPGMVPTPAPGFTFAPNKIPTPYPGRTYAPGMYPTWVPGMVPTPAPGMTYAPSKVPTPAPGSTYAPGMYPTWVPGMVPTPAPGKTYAPDRIPTPAPGSTYAPGMYPTWVPGMVPTPAPGMTFAPNKIPTPYPYGTYAPGMYPTWVPGMIPTPAPGVTYAPNKIPTPAPGSTYAPGMYPTWVPGMVPTPAPGYTYPPYLIPTPAPGKTYAPGQFPVPSTTMYPTPALGQTYPPYKPGMIPTPAPGKTYAPNLIPTPAPGSTYAPGKFPTWVPGMVPTIRPGVTVPWWLIPTPAPGSTYAPFHYPTWVPGMIPTPAPGVSYAPNKVPTPAPGKTYAPGLYPTWVPGMVPTPAPGKTFAPNKLPTPGPGLTYAPGMYPTFVPGLMVPTPAPGVTYAPNKIPTPGPGLTYAPGMYPTWVPGMVPTPAPGMTYAPNKIPTPYPGRTYAPGMYPTWVPGMVPTPAPGKTYAPNKIPTPGPGRTYAPGQFPTWVPGMVPTPAPGKTFAPNKLPTPGPGLTYAPGMYPTFIPGLMVPTPAPGYTYAPNKVPTPGPGLTYAPGMYPTWVPGMVPTPAPGYTYAPNKVPTPGPGLTYAPGMYPTWVPGMVPTPAPGMTYAPNKIPTPGPGRTYAPGMYPTWVPGMVPTPAPGYTYAPNKIPTPGPGLTYAPGMYPTWVPGMVPTPAPGMTFAPNRIPTMLPGVTYPPGMYPTWIPGMVPTPAPGQTYAPGKIPTPAPGQTYAPGMFPVITPSPAPKPTPFGIPTAIPGQIEGNAVSPNKSVSGCMYHGIVYGQGQKWRDGCQYDCECIDEHSGRFRCKERCPLYLNVPSYCRLVVDPNDQCCKIPVCQTARPTPQPTQFKVPTAQPQPGNLTPTPGNQPTPQPSNVCVMDGKQYVAGQTWYNGCAQQCVCEDGTTGFYRCYDRCTIYTKVPAGCTMVADPKDPTCCEVPQCIPLPGPGVTITPGPPIVVTGVTGVITGTNPPTSSPPSGPTPTPRNVCIYGGRTYQQGQKWQDGCKYDCICEDGVTGRYRCTERCASVPFLPPQCKMQRDPKDVCCFVPVCDYNQTVPTLPPIPGPSPSPGVSTQAPNTLPPSFCVYNGAPFFKGQTWDDGCTKKCRCDDADQNIITCFDRCTTYNNIGANCVMVSDPQDSCCQIPKCPTPPTGSITGGPQPNPITGVVPSNQGYCDYKGVHYTKGQTWDDGCKYTCQCIDDGSGQWQCDEKCPRYVQIPANCQLVQDPANKCCRKPYCPTPTAAPTPGPSGVPTPAPTGGCVMNGKTYTTGQKWFDGCDQACICSDGVTGAYSCSDRCPTYNPPPGCTMVADPRDPICCLAPQCPSANITGVTGGITGYGTPPTPTGGVTAVGKYCVYKGKNYNTGQRWQDGCQYDCECVNANIGQYKCTDRCPRYPNLPPSCHLAYDPSNPCCQKPVCGGPTPTPGTGVSPTPSTDVCVYQGVVFRQGQSINQGCEAVCVCEDGKTGRITCHERCKTYPPLSANCSLITDPNDKCCQVPSCVNPNSKNPNQIVTGVTGTITGTRLPSNNPYTGGTRNVCIYNGKSYSQGQTWDDGCKYTCECLDSSKGLYQCTEKCPSYPRMPAYCTLVQDPANKCCQKPYCTPLIAPTPVPSPGGVAPTPGPSTKVCVYKGYTYAQGQQWYDGCNADCRCENADKNVYRCQQRCSVYTSVAPGCTMVPDPKDPDCCEIPDCPIVPPVSPTPGIVTFQPGPGGVVTGIGLVPTPGPGVSPSPGYRKGCLYKGMVFQKGQKFDDGCDYECECLDDNTGKYRCVEKCTKYTTLPKQCVLIQDPQKPCCQVPYCDYKNPKPFPQGIPTPGPGLVPTPGPGVITVAPYVVPSFTSVSGPSPTPGQQGYCVYKGVYYTQGQTWDDGCSKKCRCEDVNTGYYSCAQRCHTYSNTPANCVLRADPNDACCLVPDCNQIPTPKPAPTGTLPPGVSTTPAPIIVPASISGSFTGIGTLPGSSVTGSNGACVYKGVSYKQGQKWQDGCTYDCECMDAQRGQYKCTDRCPVYVYLPNPQCYLKQSPTDSCCKVAECSTVVRPTTKAPVTSSPTPTSIVTVPVSTECVYINGQKYAKGATWQDGCSSCECKDPAGNQFICTNKCPAYSGLPSFCSLVQDPSDACCMKPQCSGLAGVSLTPYIGGGPWGSATPPTSLQVVPVGTHQTIIGYGPPTSGSGTACVYKGTTHSQGQSWNDACKYVCTCEDASSGRYKCLSKCPSYPSLPSYCRKINVPGQCCPTITCDIPGYGTYTPVPQLTPGPVPTIQPGGSTPNPQIILVPGQTGTTTGTGYPGGGYYLPNATNPQVIGTLRDKCVYKNRLYNQGDKWKDGCDFECECLDSRTGYYQCSQLCPVYNNLPSNQCYLVTAQGQCCSQPMCYDPSVGKAVNPLTSNSVFPVVGTFNGGFTGFRPGYLTNQGHGNVCVYKGTSYHQGDKWNDGCDFSCECVNQQTGMYRCNAKCPTYTKIPPLCSLVNDPADQCCKKITCKPTGYTLPPGYSTVTPAPAVSPQPSGNCTDLLNDCDQYGQAVCTSSAYRSWADRNCRAYCGFCSSTGTGGNQCKDKLNNCATYGQTICTSAVYRPWAQDNCKDYCGFCPNTGAHTGTPTPTPANTCVDNFANCASLGQFYCSDIYKVPGSYSWNNCRKYCGWCHVTITQTHSTTTALYTGPTQGPVGTTTPPVCTYKGKTYSQGQHWQDACQYNCSCDDASIGYYRCRNLCPDYQQLPPDCTLVTVQGQCCPRLDCKITVGVQTNPPVIISANKYCSYKGHFYRQDETWNDGCSQTCTCTDASRGFYSCGSVCLNWDNLPAICHLEDAPPGKCCRQPQCPSGVIINIPTTYKDEYPKSVNPNYNYV